LILFIRTEQTIRRTESRDSETEFEQSADSLELEEVVPKVDDGKIEESEVEIGRSRNEDANTSSSRQQLRNLRSSKILPCRETQTSKAYVPLKI
jgi:hypothetical protein